MAPVSVEVTPVVGGTWFEDREWMQDPMGLSRPSWQPTSVGDVVGVLGCEAAQARRQAIRAAAVILILPRL
jgi:hypothetical protein